MTNQQNKKNTSDLYARSFIEDVILATAPGQRLPGLRELMQKSQLGRIRLKRVLDEMVRCRRLEVRDRSGFYRLDDPVKEDLIFIHFSESPLLEQQQSFPGGIVYALRQEAAKLNLNLALLNCRDLTWAETADIVRQRRPKAAFIFSSVDAEFTKFISSLLPLTISVLPLHTARVGNELRDSPDMTAIQLKYLFQCNYQKIGCIHNVDEDWNRTPVQLQRLLDYYRIMAEQGLKIEPEWVFYCGYTWEHFNSRMHKLMRANRQLEALIVPGSCLQYLYRFCSNNGIAIGKELAVICCDDTAPELIPRVTSVTNTPFDIGLQVWQIFRRCQCNSGNICEYTRLQIVTGETVRHNTKQ
jgi:DNA-binding LacI/PurR family transcriptional regulator